MNLMINSKELREAVRILERKLGTLSDNKTSCCSISMAQCHALVEIGRAHNISLNELSTLLNLDNSTLSRTVNSLVTNGFVQRDVNTKDRRYLKISLTDSGQMLFSEIEESMDQYFNKLYEEIPDGKRQQVIESIQLLNDVITKNKNNE